MTAIEREYQRLVNEAAVEFSEGLEGNSFTSWHAAIAWSRRHPSPEVEALITIIRHIIQCPDFCNEKLIHRAELTIEAFNQRREEKWT